MIYRIGDKRGHPSVELGDATGVQSIAWGFVVEVNPEKQTFKAELPSSSGGITDDIPINNSINKGGVGLRIIPIAGQTIVLLLKYGGEYIHIGYALEGLEQFTEDKFGHKKATVLLQRFLDQGEIQLCGGSGNEIYLAKTGDVLIKTGTGCFIKLEDASDTMEGWFRNLKYELDGVRIRAGNTRRALRGDTKEDINMVLNEENKPVTSSKIEEVEDGKLENYIPLQEFRVDVGIQKDSEGLDKPFDQKNPSTSSPSVGYIAMGNKIIKADGTERKILGKTVKFIVETTNGGGIAITEDNSVFILDFGGGKAPTKIQSGKSSTKDMKASANSFIEVGDTGIKMNHKSRNSITVQSDKDGYGETILTNDTGRNVTLNKMGLSINMDGAYLSLTGKEININAEKVTFGGMLAAVAGDAVFKAKLTAAAIDLHMHAGPMGPPLIPLTPLVVSGALVSFGMNVG